MQTVISSITLAAPGGGTPLPAGEPVDVDETDPFIQSLIDAGTLQVVDSGNAQQWNPEAAQGPPITGDAPTEIAAAGPAATPTGTAPDSPDVHSAELASERPSESWKLDDIRAYAEANGIDVPSRATKAELLEAVNRNA